MPSATPHRAPLSFRLAGVCSASLLLAACAPTLDWRQVQPPGWSLSASLPCRPDTAERRVPLAGVPATLGLWSCKAGEHMFAIASADVGDPARVGPALQFLSASARVNIGAQPEADAPARVPGMTPHADARLQRLAGHRPDGQPLRSQVLVFAYGTRVYQVTVLGPQAGEAQARPLFESLGVRP